MQDLKRIDLDAPVLDAVKVIEAAHGTLLSQSSGPAFPTEELMVGMKCYRTDEEREYTLKSLNPPVWVLTGDMERDYNNPALESLTVGEARVTDVFYIPGGRIWIE